MGVGAGLYVYVVVVQKFTFAISSPDEFLLVFVIGSQHRCSLDLSGSLPWCMIIIYYLSHFRCFSVENTFFFFCFTSRRLLRRLLFQQPHPDIIYRRTVDGTIPGQCWTTDVEDTTRIYRPGSLTSAEVFPNSYFSFNHLTGVYCNLAVKRPYSSVHHRTSHRASIQALADISSSALSAFAMYKAISLHTCVLS